MLRGYRITLLQVRGDAVDFHYAVLPVPFIVNIGGDLGDFQIGKRCRRHGLVKHFVVYHDFPLAAMSDEADHLVEVLVYEVRFIHGRINATQTGSGFLVTIAAMLRIHLLAPNEILFEFDRISAFTS